MYQGNKIFTKAAALFFAAFLLLAGIYLQGVSAYAAVPPGVSVHNITAKPDSNVSRDVPHFSLIGEELPPSETGLTVTALKEESRSPLYAIGIVLLSVSALALCLLAVYLIRAKIKKPPGKKHTAVWASIGGAAVIFFAGFGVAGLLTGSAAGDAVFNPYSIAAPQKSENTAPDGVKGYTESLTVRKVLATFENGTDLPYNNLLNRSSHFFTNVSPAYTYDPVEKSEEKLKYQSTALADGDDANFWYSYPAADFSDEGYSEAIYRFTVNSEAKDLDTTLFDKMNIVYRGTNSRGGTAAVSIYADTRLNDERKLTLLGRYEGISGQKVRLTLDLRVIRNVDRPYLRRIVLRTDAKDIGKTADSYLKNELYYIEVFSSESNSMTTRIGGVLGSTDYGTYEVTSEYLGSTNFNLYGSYSASGMFDGTENKWKLWYGGGNKGGSASDVVWYMETTDIKLGFSEQVETRITEDKTGLLRKDFNWGGDPAVVKVDGIYHMYISGLGPTFEANRVFHLTSADGVNFICQNQVFECVAHTSVRPSEAYIYGAGSPSVIYKGGIYYLYYWTTEADRAGGLTGLLMRTSDDGYTFGEPMAVKIYGEATVNQGAFDVKYVPSLDAWVAVDYKDWDTSNVSANLARGHSIRLGFSKNGTDFYWGSMDTAAGGYDEWRGIAQNFTAGTNHNPGLIGNEHGLGYETMFVTYGTNTYPLYEGSSPGPQQDERQLELSRITIKRME